MKSYIYVDGILIDNQITFSGGERHVSVHKYSVSQVRYSYSDKCVVTEKHYDPENTPPSKKH